MPRPRSYPAIRLLTFLCCLAPLPLPLSATDAAPAIARATFAPGRLTDWVVEQQAGGTVRMETGALVINDRAGCTVWWREPLTAPVRIRFEVTVSSAGRVSDLNCFWMASDPDHPADLFAPGHGRTGAFATYDQLRLYYVGYGGNTNTTTRFRRYDGTGAKPLDPAHDLQTEPFLLVGDHTYRIEITVTTDGRTTYARDGEVVFDYTDPTPLRHGWFGFRTVDSLTRITAFEIEPGE